MLDFSRSRDQHLPGSFLPKRKDPGYEAGYITFTHLIRAKLFESSIYVNNARGAVPTLGASVAKWLAHLSFTSEAAGSNLTKYFLNATRTQSSCEKSKSQRSAESRGFSPGTPVSSHRESWQGGLGKKGPQ
jgi:hypothetical protein